MSGLDELVWSPFCGAVYSLERTAGAPVVCCRNEHGEDTQHEAESGFAWW